MPWKETEPMTERMRFMMEWESGLFDWSELCVLYGVSRKTGYKWLRRWESGGADGLRDRSRAPRGCPHRTSREVEERIVGLRGRRPNWGPVTPRLRLRREEPEVSWPAASTIGGILKRRGLSQPRRRRRKPEALFGNPERLQTQGPHEVLTADFKGQFRTGDGRYCYPLTIQDHYSRYALCCEALGSTGGGGVRKRFEGVFREYGLPEAILTDNGAPFAGVGLRRLSRLSVWWIRLGVRPLLIRRGHPEENGRHERYHLTLKEETARPPAADRRSQQRVFDRFRRDYNEERPHQALEGAKTPAEVYRPSERSYPRRLPPLEYPGHYEVRRVNLNGYVKLHGRRMFLSQVLGHETVGLEEVQDGVWSIYLGEYLLGRWDRRNDTIRG